MKKSLVNPLIFLSFLLVTSCGGGNDQTTVQAAENESGSEFLAEGASEEEAMIKEGKGVGLVKSVSIGDVDATMADAGKALFESKCTACHKLTEDKYVGPGLNGVTKKRKPEWIMNMIINPDVMTKKDPAAQELLAQYLTQMTNQNVTEDDARKILEYLRQHDSGL